MSERWRIVCDREGCTAELELPPDAKHALAREVPRRLLLIARQCRWQIITMADIRLDFCPDHHVPELEASAIGTGRSAG